MNHRPKRSPCTVECVTHVNDRRDIPHRDVLIEACCSLEHERHTSDIWYIPIRDVIIEIGHAVLLFEYIVKVASKQLRHIGDIGDTPGSHWPAIPFNDLIIAIVSVGATIVIELPDGTIQLSFALETSVGGSATMLAPKESEENDLGGWPQHGS